MFRSVDPVIKAKDSRRSQSKSCASSSRRFGECLNLRRIYSFHKFTIAIPWSKSSASYVLIDAAVEPTEAIEIPRAVRARLSLLMLASGFTAADAM